MTEASTPIHHALPGVNVLLMGGAGSGKTHSIGTLVEAGVETFFLGLEPGIESLFGFWKDRGKEIPENLHWHMLNAPKASFKEMTETAKSINLLSLDALAKQTDPNRSKYNRFIQLLEALNDFPDDRTGKKFGGVDSWTPARALVVDGMTGIGIAAMSLVVGGKAVKNQSDWGIAQDQVEKILRMLTEGCACHFVLISHIERETNQITGTTQQMIATLGRALAPKIPPMFSDVILCQRAGPDKWVWDTGTPTADVKARNLPFQSNLPADFKPLLAKWQARGGSLVSST